MKRVYFCPKCETTLNPNVKIVLVAANGGKRGLILLSPQPGNYQIYTSENLEIEKGDLLEIFCPVCDVNLHSHVDPHLAEVSFRTSQGGEGRVDFSRIAGEHATYIITAKEVRSYGENAGVYGALNFFGEGFC